MKIYAVKMPNGDQYGIPANLVAKNYADFYARRGEDWQESYDTMLRWFDAGDYEFADWAKNNMHWDDVKQDAVLISTDQLGVDFQEGWVNGDYEYMTLLVPLEEDTP